MARAPQLFAPRCPNASISLVIIHGQGMVLAETDKGKFVVELLPDEAQVTLDIRRRAMVPAYPARPAASRATQIPSFGASLVGIGPNTLSARLKRLEEGGIVERRFYEQHPPRAEYALTEEGRALGPVLLALKKWGETNYLSKVSADFKSKKWARSASLQD